MIPTDASSILNLSRLSVEHEDSGSLSNFYSLGAHRTPVSIRAQQVRAINLALALVEVGPLRSDRTSAMVIGGGISGLTAAVVLAAHGRSVTVVESQAETLNKFATSHRYLHPNVLDLGVFGREPHWSSTEAMLPLFDWSAGPARDAVSAWRSELKLFGALEQLQIGTLGKWSLPSVEGNRYNFDVRAVFEQGHRVQRAATVDVVISAAGYGSERGADGDTYWKVNHTGLGPVAIWGNADGGVREVFHAATTIGYEQVVASAAQFALSRPEDFHEATVEVYAAGQTAVGDVVARARTGGRPLTAEDLAVAEKRGSAAMQAAVASAQTAWLNHDLVELLKEHTRDSSVRIVGRTPHVYGPKASMFSNYLALHLLESGCIEYVAREFETEEELAADAGVERVLDRRGPVPPQRADNAQDSLGLLCDALEDASVRGSASTYDRDRTLKADDAARVVELLAPYRR